MTAHPFKLWVLVAIGVAATSWFVIELAKVLDP
jgi:hypothetical protein